jgi:hypothetical protein
MIADDNYKLYRSKREEVSGEQDEEEKNRKDQGDKK